MVPGIDMLRLFIQRLLNKQNPFYGDRNHIHHLLLKKYGYNKTIFFFFTDISSSYIDILFNIYLYYFFIYNFLFFNNRQVIQKI